MKSLVLFVLLASALPVFAGDRAPVVSSPVIVELFTSEGCSSCPPADALLGLLARDSGVPVIALGEHVDYWNDLGWKDRFSSRQLSERQQEYARHFRLDGPYTPQMVVDGRTEFVGNDLSAARRAVTAASRVPKPARIELRRDGAALDVSVESDPRLSPTVWLAVTEDELTTQVRSGENGGRQLHHQAVVRSLTRLGTVAAGRFSARPALRLDASWNAAHLNAVVFAQSEASGEIVGAASTPLR